MKQKSTNNIDNIISKNNNLNDLIMKANKIKKLNDFVLGLLDSKLAENTKVSNYRAGILSLSTNSPAYANQLRFDTKKLLMELKSACNWHSLKEITVKVSPVRGMDIPVVDIEVERTLSDDNATILEQLSEDIECPKLKSTLMRLAKLKHSK